MKTRIYKALSILLALMVVFSACACVLGTVAAASPKEKTYYVSANATSTKDGSQNNPFATIDEAVIKAIDVDGYGKDDTLNVIVSGEVVWSKERDKVGFDATSADDHKFKLVVTGENGAVVKTDSGKNIELGGPTEFYNVKLKFSNDYRYLRFSDNNVKFGEGTTFAMTYGTFAHLGVNSTTQPAEQTVEFDSPFSTKFYLGSTGTATTYDKNINIIYNSVDGDAKFYFGSDSKTDTKYSSNVNFNIKNAKSVTFAKDQSSIFDSNAAIHIINSSTVAINSTTGELNNITAPKWILNNKTGDKDVFGFDDQKGVFTVDIKDPTHTVIVKNSAGVKVAELKQSNKELKLDVSGEYTATLDRAAETHQYYVGKGDGVVAPTGYQLYETVHNAVEAANNQSGIISKDTVQINILGKEPVIWSATADALPAHEYKLFITSENGAVITTTDIDPNDSTKKNERNMVLGGPTEFGKVTLETCKNNGKDLRFNDKDVTFSQDTVVNIEGSVTLGFHEPTQSGTQDVVINSKISNLHMSNSNDQEKTYNENVNITFNEASTSPTFYFGNAANKDNKTITYNGLLNLNIKAANRVTFTAKALYNIGSDFALQIINSSAQEFSANKDALANITADKKLIINNRSGDTNLVEFAGEKGKFKINTTEDLSKVILKDQNGNKIPVTIDVISLTAGVYSITVDRKAKTKEYFVSPDGEKVELGKGSDDLGRTKNKPVKSFADVTRLIAQDGLTEKDTAIVRFKAGEVNHWWNGTYDTTTKEEVKDSLSAYSCKIILDSTSTSEKATISYNYMIELVGDLTFENVILKIDNRDASLVLNNKNVVFGENSVVDATAVVVGLRSNPNNVSADNDINITIEGEFTPSAIQLGNMYHDGTYNGDITFSVNNENANAIFMLGGQSNTKYTFNGNINIHILKAKTFSIANNKIDTAVNINGGLQVLVDDEVSFPYSVKTNFENFAANGGKWYITNAASDDKFVGFTDTKGKFKFTNGKTAYIRQIEAQDHYAITSNGFATLPSGAYTISDASIQFLPNDSHKMLYYRLAGGTHFLSTRMAPVLVPGKEYVYEYSIYCNLYEDCKPYVTHGDKELNAKFNTNGDEALKSYTATKVGNYYKVVCQVVIPEDYEQTKTDEATKEKYQVPGYTAFFGVWFAPGSEGYIFDRALYEKGDASKTDLFEGDNADFHDGLDYIKLDDSKVGLWAAIWGNKSLTKFDNGIQQLEVVNFSEAAIAELLRLGNPNDGEWWKVEDIVEEEEIITYASAKGVFKDSTGKAVKNAKMLLISDDNEYTATTNSKGEFNFGKIVTGFYELYVLNGSEKIFTGFSQYIAPDDEVTFNVISDLSSLMSDYETIEPGDEVEEIVPSGNLSGTVYTPYLETVANLKIYLEGVGEVTTDENGNFAFADVPVGKYKLYAVLEDGSEYVFREVDIQENVDLKVKLKYDPPKQSITDDVNNGWIIWVIVASVVALVVVAGLIFFLVIRKKKAVQE